MDLTKLSDQDLQALKSGDLSKLSDSGLATLKGMTPQQLAQERFSEVAAGKETARGIPYSVRRSGEMALEGMSGVEKLRAGYGMGTMKLVGGVDQLIGGRTRAQEDERQARDAPLASSGAGMVGSALSTAVNGSPLLLAPGAQSIPGAMFAGAMMGAAEPVGTNDSRGFNALLGAAAGGAGQAVGRGINRAIRPVNSQLTGETARLAQAAQARGIPLDAADLTGSRPLTIMRDVLSNMPLTADRQAAIQQTKQQAFNRAVGNTFGANADEITAPVLQGARNRLGQEFTDLAARNSLTMDHPALGRVQTILQEAGRYSTPDVERVVRNFWDDVVARLDQNGTLPGQAYRALDSQMGRVMRSSSNGDIRHAVGQLRNVLRDTMDAGISAADQDAWRTARQQYANMMTVAPLAARDGAGDVSGRALLAAALRGNRQGAFNGAGELGELGRIGRQFVAEQTPNSGTAQRTFYERMLSNPLTAIWQQSVGGASRPVQMALNSPAGQRYFSQGLAQLTPRQQAMIEALTRSTAVGASANAMQQ